MSDTYLFLHVCSTYSLLICLCFLGLSLPYFNATDIQWKSTIKDTIGDLHFVFYRVVSLTEGLCVIRSIDNQYYLCMYAHDDSGKRQLLAGR